MTRRVAFASLVLLLAVAGFIEYQMHHRTAARDAAFARFDLDSPSMVVSALDGTSETDIGKAAADWEKSEYDRGIEHLSNLRKPVWGIAGVLAICGVLLLRTDRRHSSR